MKAVCSRIGCLIMASLLLLTACAPRAGDSSSASSMEGAAADVSGSPVGTGDSPKDTVGSSKDTGDSSEDTSGSSKDTEISSEDTSDLTADTVTVFAPAPDPGPQPDPEPGPVLTQEDIDDALDKVMSRYSAAGVTVATVEDGLPSQSGAWGWAVKGERRMTPDTKIRIASISKVVVAMCAMAMAEDGFLDLDAPLSDYWGAGAVNPYGKGQPTVRDLMTHTSSLKDLDPVKGLEQQRRLLQNRSSWRDMDPGNGGYWFYSNFGISVLGTTLELAWDGLLDDYLQDRLLAPIGAHATFCGGKLDADEVATLYSGGGVGRSAAAHASQSIPQEIGGTALYFAGGYTTSAVDMAKLIAVLVNDGVYKDPVWLYTVVEDTETGEQLEIAEPMPGKFKEIRLLSQASVADLETPRFTVDLKDYSPFQQCLVLRRQENVMGRDTLYYHTGSAYGVFSLMTYDPDQRDGIVVITTGAARNMNERGMYALCADLMEILYQKMEADAQ